MKTTLQTSLKEVEAEITQEIERLIRLRSQIMSSLNPSDLPKEVIPAGESPFRKRAPKGYLGVQIMEHLSGRMTIRTLTKTLKASGYNWPLTDTYVYKQLQVLIHEGKVAEVANTAPIEYKKA